MRDGTSMAGDWPAASAGRGGGDAVPYAVAFVVAVALVLTLSGSSRGLGPFVDADTLMRMVRLRESLATGTWGVVVPGGDLGRGLVLHWSHLQDALLAGPVLALAPLLGLDRAVTLVAQMTGPVVLGLIAVAACWAVAPWCPPRATARLMPALLATSPAIFVYTTWGNGDHHGPMLLAFVVTCGAAGRLLLGPPRPAPVGAVMGATMGFALWLAPEGLLFCLFAAALPWAAWVAAPPCCDASTADPAPDTPDRRGVGLAASALAFAGLVWFALLVNPPPGGPGRFELDRLSLPFAIAAAAYGVAGLAALRIPAGRGRPVFVVGATLAMLALVLALRPWWQGQLWGGEGFDLQRVDWSTIRELQPLDTPSRIAAYSGLGLPGSLLLLWRSRGAPWLVRLALAGALLAIAVLALRYLRFAPYLSAIGAMVGTLALLHPAIRGQGLLRGVLWAAAAAAALLGPLLALGGDKSAAAAGPDLECRLETLAGPLAAERGRLVLAFRNLAPQLAWYGPGVGFVGANYHRGVAGLLADQEIAAAPPAELPALLHRYGIDRVLACVGGPRQPWLAAAADGAGPVSTPGGTFAHWLHAGRVPPWLEPMTPWPEAVGPVLFRVVPPEAGAILTP